MQSIYQEVCLEFWLDPESPYYKKDIPLDKDLILFCAQGMRSALATKTLKDMGFERVSHIEGGFEKLKEFGFETSRGKKKIVIFLLHSIRNLIGLGPKTFFR